MKILNLKNFWHIIFQKSGTEWKKNKPKIDRNKGKKRMSALNPRKYFKQNQMQNLKKEMPIKL